MVRFADGREAIIGGIARGAMSFIVDEKIEEYAERHSTPPDPLLAELAEETQGDDELAADAHRADRGAVPRAARPRVRREAGARDRHLHRLLGALDGRGAAGGRSHRHARHRAEARRGRAALLRPKPARLEDHPPPRPSDRDDRELEGEFDLVFIDADKEGYDEYYEAVLPRLSARGLIAIDNTLWSGRVLDPQDESTKKIAELNDKIAADDRVVAVQLTVRDGVTLIRRR